MPPATQKPIRIVGLGEALFDRFPDSVILGGAPLNLAFHAHQLIQAVSIGEGIIVSRIGNDELGERLLEELSARSMDASYISRDATYDITADAAWDHIPFDPALGELAATCDAVCFGTLAQRSPTSRSTIDEFLTTATSAFKVCDVNLRQNYYTPDILTRSLNAADAAKLNEEELVAISQALTNDSIGSKDSPLPNDILRDPIRSVRRLLHRFDLRFVALTRGPRGTVLITKDAALAGDVPRFSMEPNADSVGAGDASCAGLICGELLQLPLRTTLKIANHLGAFVASKAGATPEFDHDLRDWLRKQTTEGPKQN